MHCSSVVLWIQTHQLVMNYDYYERKCQESESRVWAKETYINVHSAGYERFLYFQLLTMKKSSLVLLIIIPYLPSASSKGTMNTVDFHEEFLCRVKTYNQNNNALPPIHPFSIWLTYWPCPVILEESLTFCGCLGMPSLVLVPEAFAEFCKPKHSEELGFVETGQPCHLLPVQPKLCHLATGCVYWA